ncbi:hypothetical protein [Halobacteriovorax sp.]|uniref:hypothetical protein n=1 Tax=Halobacteriovorax sp. TaxID=2020862 RepID=UPI003AF22196
MFKKIFPTLMFTLLTFNSYALQEYAAPFSSVNSAKCLQEMPTLLEISKFSNKFLHRGNKQVAINGFNFRNESETSSRLFRSLTRSYVLKKLDKHKDFSHLIKAAKNCDSIRCALNELFKGQEMVYKTIYLSEKYGLNTSPYRNNDAALLNLKQMNAILKGINLIPSHFPRLWKSKRLVRHIKEDIGYGHVGMIFANASIELYTPWDRELDKDGKAYTLFHEIGHNLAYFYNLNYSSFWWDMSGWIDHPMGWRYNRDEMVSTYGQTNPGEDAAESIAAYRLNPTNLKKVSPKKYAFIRDYIYLGQEYLSSSSCGHTPVKDYLNKVINKAWKNCSETSCVIKNIRQSIKKDNRFPLFNKAKDDFFEVFL